MVESAISEDQLRNVIDEISKRLRTHGIPIDIWGQGEAKTIRHLAREIVEGESVLIEKDGKIVRMIVLVHVDVRYISGDLNLQLVEDRQVFTDGRERRRNLIGLSEKMKPGENPFFAALRALSEEMGIHDELTTEYLRVENGSKTSPSYPGLATDYLRHEMQTCLPPSAFKHDGYVESQPDKSTYFTWRELLE